MRASWATGRERPAGESTRSPNQLAFHKPVVVWGVVARPKLLRRGERAA